MDIQEGKLEVRLLGGCEVLVNRTVPPCTLSLGACGILTLLILQRKKALTRQKIGETIWDPTHVANSDANFRQGLLGLRKVLAAEEWRLKEHKEGPIRYLRLDLRNAEVDVVDFEEALQHAQQTNTLSDWEKAIRIYQGDLLADYEAPWILWLREELRKKWLNALEAGAEAAQQINVPDRAQTLLQALLQASPCHERAARKLMVLFAEQQRLEEALQVYSALNRSLHESGQSLVEAETGALYERLQKIRWSGRAMHRLPTPTPTTPPLPRLLKLPAPINTLIGRTEEVGRIAGVLATSRCVTLTGAGGVGKTRLALEAAWNEAENYQAGAVFVDFSNLPLEVSEDDIHRLVAETLEVREAPGKKWQDRIIAEIGRQHQLLVLDNCEHILRICTPLVDCLLSRCPYLHILATSREPLHARGERYLQIPPLSHPSQRAPYSQQDLLKYDATQLFLARVTLPDFTLTDADVAPLAWLCRTLDGIPLALELAASLLDYFGSIENLNKQLRRSFWFLQETSRADIPRRYRVLRETIAWSYDLLSSEERQVLRALSAIWGSSGEEAIVAIAGLADTIAVSQCLLRKSLLNLSPRSSDEDPNAPQRYRLTEPIRQYALEKLVDATEQEEVLLRHATYFLTFVESAERELQGAEQQNWLYRLDTDRQNCRAAMRWVLQATHTEMALRFGVALCRYWAIRGQHQEGAAFLREALELPGETPTLLRARALNGAGNLAYLREDYAYSKNCFLQYLEISQSMGNTFFKASALVGLANIAIGEQDYTNAKSLLLEATEHFESLEDGRNLAITYGNLANVATHLNDKVLAATYHRRSIVSFRQLSDHENLALGLNNFCHTLLKDGVSPEHPMLLQEALAISLSLSSPPLFTHTLFNTISLAMDSGNYLQAALLIGANEVYREIHHLPLPTLALASYTERWERTRQRLGENEFQKLVAQGNSLGETQIIDQIRILLDAVSQAAEAR